MERESSNIGEVSEKQAKVDGLLTTQAMVLLGPELQPKAMSVPLPPVTIEGQKSWLCPSLATAIGRSGPNPHWRDQGNPSPCLCNMTELTLLVGVWTGCP